MKDSHKLVVEKRDGIIDIVSKISNEYLTEQYLQKSIKVCDEIINENAEALLKGKESSWACGIIHILGTEMGLFLKDSNPHMKVSELYKIVGVSSSTGLNKSKEIKNILGDKIKEIIKETPKGNEEVAVEGIHIKVDEDECFKKAQDLMKEAWNAKNFKMKVKYAQKALDTCSYCSDAYIILAKDNKKTPTEKEELLEKALQASFKLIDVKSIKDIPEELWNSAEIQPIIGTKYKLACQLWENGKCDEAIMHLQEILEHDKKDMLMIRAVLVNWYLVMDKLEEASNLINRYNNDYLTAIQYSKVVLSYKKKDLEEASKLFKKANKLNPFVYDYIIRLKRVPRELPIIRAFGTEEEAIHYMKNGFNVWKNTDGIIEWVKEQRKAII